MAGLISSLHNSSGALKVHSKGLEVVGKNLANINNRNYAKQRVEIGDRGQINTDIATESMGVEAMGLRQNRDALLDKSVMRELTATASLEATQKVIQNAETALGQFLDRTKDSTSIQNALRSGGGGISDALTDFFNAWESVSVKPGDIGEKQLLLEKAKILAEKINQTDQRLKQVQLDVDEQVNTDVGVVNGILNEIAKINEYIAKAELVKPYSAVDLRDQRQAKLEELSKYIDVQFGPVEVTPATNPPQVDPNGLGQIFVRSGGIPLVDRKTVFGQTQNPDGSPNGPFTYNSANRTLQYDSDGNGPTASVIFNSSGKIQAQLDSTSTTGSVQVARNDIDKLAKQLTSSVNVAYNLNLAPDKQTKFFSDPPTGLKVQFNTSITSANLRTSDQVGGGNQTALRVAAIGTKIFSTITPTPPDFIDGSFTAFFNKTVTTVAQQLSSTNIRLEDQKLSEQNAINSRDQYSGVSQDEEITDMMKFQRSFQASARHINVLDTLLEQVVNRLGVG
ncbi:MAG: flagellar hook-associated protein FlgK [Verrucomicrobiota bacterium]